MVKISVIVPVFNAGMNLTKCINSILVQTEKNIELIIINDGSIDDSLSIIKRFKEKDDRVKFISQENKGVSAARNKGLEVAVGKWVAFVDADDNVEPEFISSLAALIQDGGVQLGILNANNINEDRSRTKRLQLKSGTFNFSDKPEKAVTELMQFKWDYSNWNKIYNAEIIRQQNIRFNEDIQVGEDLLFNLEYLHYVSTLAVADECLYNYHFHTASVMNSNNEESMIVFNKIYKVYIEFCKTYNMENEAIAFQKEISRMYYFQLVNKKLQSEKKKGNGFIKSIQTLAKTLRTLDSGIFFYEKGSEKNMQTFKRKLLSNGHYKLFSIIAVLTSRFK